MDVLATKSWLRDVESEHDARFLFTLYVRTREHEVASWGWTYQQMQDFLEMQWMMQRHSYQAQFPSARDFLIVPEDVPVGRCLIDINNVRLHLIDFAVLPASRGRGIGSAVLELLKRCATRHGVPLRLSVSCSNPAQHLYRSAGFEEISRTETHLGMQWQPRSFLRVSPAQ